MKFVPSVARMVHYVMGDGTHLAGMITKVWSDECVNLVVFTDNPFQGDNLGWPTSVRFTSVELATPGTCHWPERTESK